MANVARAIGRALGGSTPRELPLVVVNKSTVPVGSAYYVSTLVDDGIDEAGGEGAEFRVASNPEFLREGSAVRDSLFPDRVVVGTDSREALDALRAVALRFTPLRILAHRSRGLDLGAGARRLGRCSAIRS